jgi:two-component system sensor histidine kinase UhpB
MKTREFRKDDLKIWVIEDNPGDLILLQEMLIDLDFKSKNIKHFRDLESFEEALTSDAPSILFLDLFVPGSQGIETFQRIKPISSRCPIIILSGLDSMDIALECVKMGAQDYLVKDEMSNEMLDKMIIYAIERFSNTKEIRVSEEKYRILFHSIPLAVIMLDEDHNILEINNAATQMLNVRENIKGCTYSSIFSEPSSKGLALDGLQRSKNVLIKLVNKDEKARYLEQASTSNMTSGGARYLVTLTDRTEIIENEINRERIVHETLDEERNRVSSELHDGLAQYLVVLNLHLDMLKGIDEKVDQGLILCQEAVSTSLKLVRSISYMLSPPDMEKGLIPALKALFLRLQNVNNVNFELVTDDKTLKSDLSFFDEYSVFRMVQEFINNSLKYSECLKISCDIACQDGHLCITLNDDGKGFDIEAVQKGLGLINMKQRAFSAGFELNLQSQIGVGTSLKLYSEKLIPD